MEKNVDNIKYIIGQYVRFGIQNNTLYCGFGSIQKKIEDQSLQRAVISIAKLWQQAQSINEISKAANCLDVQVGNINKAIDFLISNKFVCEVDHIAISRHHRSHLYYALSGANPTDVQAKLSKAKVAILGCGGIGNIVGVNLVTMGIGKLVLVDDDIVELTNLTRQVLFDETSIGKSKSVTLKNQFKIRNSEVEVISHNLRIESEEQLARLVYISGGIDLFVVSADAGNILPTINSFCLKTKIPFINIGYIEDIAVFGPMVVPGETGCLFCQEIAANMGEASSELMNDILSLNNNYQAPSIGPINMMSGALASLDIVKYLGEFGQVQSLNKRVGLWTDKLRFEYQDCSPNPACVNCQRELRHV